MIRYRDAVSGSRVAHCSIEDNKTHDVDEHCCLLDSREGRKSIGRQTHFTATDCSLDGRCGWVRRKAETMHFSIKTQTSLLLIFAHGREPTRPRRGSM